MPQMNPRGFVRRNLLLGTLSFLAVSALLVPRAFAGRWGWGGGCNGAMTQEQLGERMHDGAEHVLDRVDATDEQSAAVHRIVDGLVPDAFAYAGERRELAVQMQAALAAPVVDAQELERI